MNNAMETHPALILIDIQNDYFPGGRMELAGSTEAGQAAGSLLAAFRAAKLPVAHIQHVANRPGATFFLPETEGVRPHSSVTPLDSEPVFIKHYPNSFRETPLLEHLRTLNVSRLVVAGMMTHMCVDTTVRAAADLGLSCLLAHDACATRTLSFQGRTVEAKDVQAAFLAALQGLFAEVLPAAEISRRLWPACSP